MMNSVLGLSPRKQLLQILSFGLIVCSALAIWKSLMVVTNNKSPIVVVLSGSMEPAFYRGDLLFLYNDGGKYNVGDIVVFELKGKEIPIVHRIIKVHEDNDGRTRLLTKGDNNAVDDRGLYIRGQSWLDPEDVIGTVHGYLPYVGVVTILMNDYPMLKFGLIGVLALFVVFDRNQAT